MNILQINASARREAANSTRVANSITARLQAANPAARLTVRDLAVTPHPVLDETALGGSYRGTEADSQVPYLKTVLGFLGMSDVHFIYAEGLNIGAEAAERGFAQAEADLAAALA